MRTDGFIISKQPGNDNERREKHSWRDSLPSLKVSGVL